MSMQKTRLSKAKDAVCNWLVHLKLSEDGHSFHPRDGGAPWTKVHRPTAAQCYFFVQQLHESHHSALGTPFQAEQFSKEIKEIHVRGGPGVTKSLRDRVRPIGEKYILSDMSDVYEVQAARRDTASRDAEGTPDDNTITPDVDVVASSDSSESDSDEVSG